MKNNLILVLMVIVQCVMADYIITQPQPIARGLTEKQLDVVISKAPATAQVTLPAHLLAKKKATIEENLMVEELKVVIADTRNSITECKNMSDVEIASLYIQQMSKTAKDINVDGTNTIDKIIGAGMRADIKSRSIKQ